METFRIRAFVTQEGGKSNRLEFKAEGAYQAGQRVEHALRLFAGSVSMAITVDELPQERPALTLPEVQQPAGVRVQVSGSGLPPLR